MATFVAQACVFMTTAFVMVVSGIDSLFGGVVEVRAHPSSSSSIYPRAEA